MLVAIFYLHLNINDDSLADAEQNCNFRHGIVGE